MLWSWLSWEKKSVGSAFESTLTSWFSGTFLIKHPNNGQTPLLLSFHSTFLVSTSGKHLSGESDRRDASLRFADQTFETMNLKDWKFPQASCAKEGKGWSHCAGHRRNSPSKKRFPTFLTIYQSTSQDRPQPEPGQEGSEIRMQPCLD